MPRFYLYHLAQEVRGMMWTFVPSTDGNEDDLYGVLHDDTGSADSFTPRPAYHAAEVTSALFGKTQVDPMAEFEFRQIPGPYNHGALTH